MARTPPPPTTTPPRAEVRPGIWLDARLGVFFESLALLVVADLHWGYVESHRRRGNLLPDWGDDEIERRLNALIADYGPREMLWLGDSLHAVTGRTRAERYLESSSVPVTILAGNHDATWKGSQGRELRRDDFHFHHGDRPAASLAPGCIEVLGHHHPAMSWWDGAGTRLKLPALVVSPIRIILPAFSPWSSGTPWQKNDPSEKLWAIAPRRIFAVP